MKIIQTLCVTLMCFFTIITFATETITASTPDKSIVITAKKQHTFNIILPSNPTTGYSWFLTDYNHQLLKPVNHQYVAPNNKLMGAGGFEIWTFNIQQEVPVPQKTTVTFTYQRPWETNDAKTETFTVLTQ